MSAPKRILITGPESSGKSSLATALAEHFDAQLVAEQARIYLDQYGPEYTLKDLEKIASQQARLEAETFEQSNSFLFCDTGPFVLHIWAQERFGKVLSQVEQWIDQQNYDAVILCQPDLKWEYDPLREHANQRDYLFKRYQEALLPHYPDTFILSGQGENRTRSAISFVEGLPS